MRRGSTTRRAELRWSLRLWVRSRLRGGARSGAVCCAAWLALGVATPLARAAEHITLKNGFELDCMRREVLEDGRVRLFLFPASGGLAASDKSLNDDESANYLDVAVDAVVRVETVADPVSRLSAVAPAAVSVAASRSATGPAFAPATAPARVAMQEMLASAGSRHNVDKDLLASVVKAESGGQVRAVSRTGAQGLMQLMPGTAREQGVADAFRPEQNIAGGTAYLDQLLTRYHDNVALALAAYNAGPAAVDRYHGIPPYRETRAYVARVIREFNRRKQLAVEAIANDAVAKNATASVAAVGLAHAAGTGLRNETR